MSPDPLRLGLLALEAGLLDAAQLARIAHAAGQTSASVEPMLRALLGDDVVEALTGGRTLDMSARLPPGSLPTLSTEQATAVETPDLRAMLAMGLSPAVFARRYSVGHELGRGGVGVVTLAEDALMGRTVAVKSLLAERASDAQIARFVAEARTTAQLDHPNIVPVHDFGQLADGAPCFTMRRVRGRSLEAVLRARQQSEPGVAEQFSDYRLLQVLGQVCMAADYAHSKGVVHRDLKPGNVMVGDFGEVLVMDWGVAKVAGQSLTEDRSETVVSADSSTVTAFGAIVGTPGYMPPEQARGELDHIDARSDVWALGAILYEMLTGHRPHEGRSALTVLIATANGDIVPPSKLATRHVPPDLEEICLKALAMERDHRFPSARALFDELERYQAGTRESERRHAEAERLVADGDESRWYIQMLEGEMATLRERLTTEPALTGHEALEVKRQRWALEDRVRHLEGELSRAFDHAAARYDQAIERVPEHDLARALLSDLHWTRYRAARGANERGVAERHLDALTQLGDPRYAQRVGGKVPLTLHTEPAGVEVALYRVTERDRILVPVGRRVIGRTPLVEVPIPTGRHLLELRAPGRRAVRLPVLAWHGDELRFGIPLPTDDALGADFVYVPGGSYVRGGDPKAVLALPNGQPHVPGFAIQRYPVTVGEYLRFLTSLPRDEAVRRAPREPRGGATLFAPPEDGVWRAPIRDRDGDWWDPAWPVCSVSYQDAEAYAAWRSTKDGVPYRLPTEDEWEKAARGTDGRRYPWGDHFDPTFCSMRRSVPGNLLPKPIGTFEADCSPYGVRDMAGGVREWVDSWFEEGQRVIRGGAFSLYAFLCRSASRWGAGPRTVQPTIGFRLVKGLPE